MDVDPDALESRRQLMERIAREAGEIIEQVRDRARSQVEQKSMNQGPVTEADLAADTYLRSEIAKHWPDDALISEESWVAGSSIQIENLCWIVDPLDGTKDFIRGGGDYSVMIGFAVQQQPVLGVVYQPSERQMWSGNATSGLCEYIDPQGERHSRSVQHATVTPNLLRVAISRSHPENVLNDLLDTTQIQTISKGSVGLKVALIIDDKADVYLSGSTRTKVWDTCGPHALIRAAGGEMQELPGSQLEYATRATHPRGIIAWSPAAKTSFGPQLHQWLADNAHRTPFA